MSDSLITAEIDILKLGEKTIFKEISFLLNKGEFVVLLGRNGAGKSSFIKNVTQEIVNAHSKVTYFGKDVKKYKLKELAQKRSVLMQNTHLTFAYDVIDVVLLGRIPHSHLKKDVSYDLEIARACLKEVGLESYEDRNYLTLSGGEQQRVQIARTLAQIYDQTQECVYILDEPTNNLDIAYQYHTLKMVKGLTKKGVGVLAVLHDLNLAAQFADKIALFNDGKLFLFGAPKDVLTRENIFKAYGHDVLILKHPTGDFPLIVSDFKY